MKEITHRILLFPELLHQWNLHLAELCRSTWQLRQVANSWNLFGKCPKTSQLNFVFPPQTLRSILFLSTLIHLAHNHTDSIVCVLELVILNFIDDGKILRKKNSLFCPSSLDPCCAQKRRLQTKCRARQQRDWTR